MKRRIIFFLLSLVWITGGMGALCSETSSLLTETASETGETEGEARSSAERAAWEKAKATCENLGYTEKGFDQFPDFNVLEDVQWQTGPASRTLRPWAFWNWVVTAQIRFRCTYERVTRTFPSRIHVKTRVETFNPRYAFILRYGKIWYRPQRQMISERSIPGRAKDNRPPPPPDRDFFAGRPLARFLSHFVKDSPDQDTRGIVPDQLVTWEHLEAVPDPGPDAWKDWKFLRDLPEDLTASENGGILSISSDDQYLVAINRNRQIFTMFGGLDGAEKFEWTESWGSPLWYGTGHRVPPYKDWDASFFSPRLDGYYVTPSQRSDWVGLGVTTLYALQDNGYRITYLDPWLPADYSYEVCGPERGRFRADSLSSSGSSLLVMSSKGVMYSRQSYDFDTSGADWLFFNSFFHDTRHDEKTARQLPAFPWLKEPTLPGGITGQITLVKHGKGGIFRTIRVEGERWGKTGYYQKLMRTQLIPETETFPWEWVETGHRLTRSLLHHRSDFLDGEDLVANHEYSYVRNLEFRPTDKISESWSGHLTGFNSRCSPAQLDIRLRTGERFSLILHTIEHIRMFSRDSAEMTEDEPVYRQGVIEIPAELWSSHRDRTAPPRVSRFIERNFGPLESGEDRNRFIGVGVTASPSHLSISLSGTPWEFVRE